MDSSNPDRNRNGVFGFVNPEDNNRIIVLSSPKDTGRMHLADGFGVPLVAVFGSTEPRLTGPRSPRSIVLRHQMECSPCFLRECPLDFGMRCVPPEEAVKAILALLRWFAQKSIGLSA